MRLNIKTKVLLGFLFIFVEFLIIGIISVYFFSSINVRTGQMIKDNYRSVQYSENMIKAIDEIHLTMTSCFLNKTYHFDKNSLKSSYKNFEDNLHQQSINITETGEKELSQSINQKYFKYKTLISNIQIDTIKNRPDYYFMHVLPLVNEIKANIFSVSNLNMQAIMQKNDNLNESVMRIYKNLILIFTICCLITYLLIFNFPNNIVKPIIKITEKIEEIAEKKFKTQINFSSENEVTQLSEAFEFVIRKLEEDDNHFNNEMRAKDNKTIKEKEVLYNIQGLLSSISKLMMSLENIENKDLIYNQSKIISKVEQDLIKIIQ
jgi:nitrate/nitrite-specific signal transduction histidine kinase